jgi:hypothetical protein
MAYHNTATHTKGSRMHRLTTLLQATIIVVAGVLPLIFANSVNAATLTSRRVTITSSKTSQTGVSYSFNFTLPSTTAVQSIRFEFCDAPLGACSHPAGLDNNYTLASTNATQTFSEATAFTEYSGADAGACDDHNNGTPANSTEYCVTRTDTDAETAAAKTITLDTITNPSSATTIYIRISLYSDTGFATEVHNGTVAAAIVDQLTINGRVQERLNFCVAAMDEDDVEPVSVSACTGLTDSNVDIGVIEDGSVAVAPVEPTTTNGSDDDFGILMVNTNASGGVSVGYFPEDPTSVSGGDTDQLKSFRVVPTNCDASAASLVDQCFVSAGNSGDGDVITSGTELFGMYIPCVYNNTNSNPSSTTSNLVTTNDSYDGDDEAITGTGTTCEAETFTSGTAEIAWNASGTTDNLISSANVVDDEIVKLRFAATASSTTPTGSYTVVTTYIATATF